MGISVCMASYNGEKYIARQLHSILDQLAEGDEVIVVDDCSTDASLKVIESLGDARIQVHVNDRNRGEVYSFGRAILLARQEVVFLSDQDDIWVPGRAALLQQRLLESGVSLVTSNFDWITADEQPIHIPYDGVDAKASHQHVRNIADIFIGKTNYFGCGMAFRRDFARLIVPMPDYVESHDLWIALASNLVGSNLHIDDKTLLKRKHGNNATSTVSTRSLYKKLRARWIFVLSLITLLGRRVRMMSA